MPPMPEGAKEGILKGIYLFQPSAKKNHPLRAQLLGSGAIIKETLKAQKILDEKYNVAADVWSVTSYKELRREALDVERWNLLHPGELPKVPFVTQCLSGRPGVFVAVSDYVKTLPDSISKWIPGSLHSLGTDGFGRSEGGAALRDFFEVDARHIVLATLSSLSKEKKIHKDLVQKAIKDMDIIPEKSNPLSS